MAYTPDPSTRYYDADGAKIVRKKYYVHVHNVLKLIIKISLYTCVCIALHYNKTDTQLVRIIIVKEISKIQSEVRDTNM